MTVDELKTKYAVQQNDASDILADFRRSLPALYKKAATLYKSEGVKGKNYQAAYSRLFYEMQRLRNVGMDQKALYSEYLKKIDTTFPKY